MKKIFGGILVVTPALLVFASDITTKGLVASLIVWGGMLLVLGLMMLGLYWLLN